MESILLLVTLVALIIMGAPVGFTLILIPVVYIFITDAAPLILIPSQMFSAIDAVPLTAIPFFMLTGELMTSATITDRLVELSRRIIGRMRGSMAQANVLVSMFFAGMNGSVVADTATVGSLLIPTMKKSGYPPAFAAAITAVSSTIGGIIPPSIMMIVLANAGGISVGALFAGGIIPGLMIGLLLMIINYIIAKRNNFERSEEPFSLKALAISSYRSSFALLIPVVLVGSVVFGIAGVVEAGALTAAIALLVGLFIYRTITWNNCKNSFIRAFRNSAMVFIIIAASGPFSWLLTSLGAINDLEQWLLGYTYKPFAVQSRAGAVYLLARHGHGFCCKYHRGRPGSGGCDGESGLSRYSSGARCRGRISNRFCNTACGSSVFHSGCDCKCAIGKSSSSNAALSGRSFRSFVYISGRARIHHVLA